MVAEDPSLWPRASFDTRAYVIDVERQPSTKCRLLGFRGLRLSLADGWWFAAFESIRTPRRNDSAVFAGPFLAWFV
jgi:hypothetical protein